MRRLALLLALLAAARPAGATFSIAAVDPATGEVGSAGASCISGSIILSDVHPGVGTIHTQAYWNGTNQANASDLMDQGWSPQAIIDWLATHDAQGNPSIRQYGIADLVGGGRSAAYTGANCTDWAGHITGPTYSVQGNILLGPEIVAAMEAAFLTTPGPLALKLMATLQAANVPGADTRCAGNNKPAISAFIRVARPGDTPGNFYLDLNVNNTSAGQNPIDLLQAQFDAWLPTAAPPPPAPAAQLLPAAPNPFNPRCELRFVLAAAGVARLEVLDLAGRRVALLAEGWHEAGEQVAVWDGRDAEGRELGSGIYLARLEAAGFMASTKLVLIR
jgi:uncharacterized Ntn-hydrolase superfamily protein